MKHIETTIANAKKAAQREALLARERDETVEGHAHAYANHSDGTHTDVCCRISSGGKVRYTLTRNPGHIR